MSSNLRSIQGLEDWSLVMIRDLIVCMEKTIKAGATVQPSIEKQGSSSVRRSSLVGVNPYHRRPSGTLMLERRVTSPELGRHWAQLLKYWEALYPDSQETVESIREKCKQLILFEQQVKKQLMEAGLMAPSFQGFEGWTLEMIRDFIVCMDKAQKKVSQMKLFQEQQEAGTLH